MAKLLSRNVVLICTITIIVEYLFTIPSPAFSFFSLCTFDCHKHLIDVICIYVITSRSEIFSGLLLIYITSSHIFAHSSIETLFLKLFYLNSLCIE